MFRLPDTDKVPDKNGLSEQRGGVPTAQIVTDSIGFCANLSVLSVAQREHTIMPLKMHRDYKCFQTLMKMNLGKHYNVST